MVVIACNHLWTLLFLFIGTTTSSCAFSYQIDDGRSSVSSVVTGGARPMATPRLFDKLTNKKKNLSQLKSSHSTSSNDVDGGSNNKLKKWFKEEYWFNEKIHSFGNIGFFGGFHAAMSPLATRVIDILSYNGKNARNKIAEDLHEVVAKKAASSNAEASSPIRVIDLGCGVGESTRALEKAFQSNNKNYIVGVDTSPQMIAIGRLFSIIRQTSAPLRRNLVFFSSDTNNNNSTAAATTANPVADYACENAESTQFPSRSFDLVTIMYVLHEAPFLGRYRILREARRLLSNGGTLAIVDISPDYKPSRPMLAGEPYVIEYKKNIQRQLRSLQGFSDIQYEELVPGHVGVWLLTRCNSTNKHINYMKKRGYEVLHLHSYIWNRLRSKGEE